MFKVRWVLSVFWIDPWLKTKLKSHVVLYWVKYFVSGEDGDLVWRDEFVSFKQQHAKALSELERHHNIFFRWLLILRYFNNKHKQVSLVIRYWRISCTFMFYFHFQVHEDSINNKQLVCVIRAYEYTIKHQVKLFHFSNIYHLIHEEI